jgi:hypothetical protein
MTKRSERRSRVEWLEAEGALDPATLSDTDKKKIEELDDAHIEHLVRTRKKVGNMASRPGGSPWIL